MASDIGFTRGPVLQTESRPRADGGVDLTAFGVIRATGVSSGTLARYRRQGLVVPEQETGRNRQRGGGHSHWYTPDQVRQIVTLSERGKRAPKQPATTQKRAPDPHTPKHCHCGKVAFYLVRGNKPRCAEHRDSLV